MKALKTSALFFLVIVTILYSCKKDDSQNNSTSGTEVSTSVQLSVTDDQIADGIATAMDAADGQEDGGADMRPTVCVDITVNTDLKKVTVDFGTGCPNQVTGRTRSGKIIIGYTGDSYIHATARTFQFVNFKTIDSITLNGTFTQSNLAHDGSTVSFSLSSTDFTFGFADGKTHTLTDYARNFIIDLGNDIRDFSDNTTTITGSTIGINKEGEVYSVDITTPVVFKGSCIAEHIFYPASGSYDVKIGNRPKYTLSWGAGQCDKIITVSYFGINADIILK